MRIADRIYAAQKELEAAEDQFMEFLESIGVPDQWEDFIFDEYDLSFELTGCKPELELTKEQQEKIWEQGFCRGWLCEGPKGIARLRNPEKYYWEGKGE